MITSYSQFTVEGDTTILDILLEFDYMIEGRIRYRSHDGVYECEVWEDYISHYEYYPYEDIRSFLRDSANCRLWKGGDLLVDTS